MLGGATEIAHVYRRVSLPFYRNPIPGVWHNRGSLCPRTQGGNAPPPALEWERCPTRGGRVPDVPTGTDAHTATLLWLMGTLERAREGGQERLVGHLEAVAEEAVFEAEAVARTS